MNCNFFFMHCLHCIIFCSLNSIQCELRFLHHIWRSDGLKKHCLFPLVINNYWWQECWIFEPICNNGWQSTLYINYSLLSLGNFLSTRFHTLIFNAIYCLFPCRQFSILQWGLSRDGELLKKYSQKPNYYVSVDINLGLKFLEAHLFIR